MLRLLFVDDEPNLLNGLQRMLRTERLSWAMRFAGSGAEALQMLEAEPADVVVTDMKMPGMNGVELLTEIKERHPGTIRIILSGHADLDSSMRSTLVSHQFISKPCEAETLRSTIKRSCELTDLMTSVGLHELLGSIGSLPVVPKIYQSLTEALAQEEIDLREVSRIVEQDIGISAKILQLVNSSYFGVRREINSLEQATTYLGATTLRDLALSLEVFGKFSQLDAHSGVNLDREQHHAMLTARVAKRISPDKKTGEQAFLAGMLHDVGRLVIAAHMGRQNAEVTETARLESRPRYLVEEERLGLSHAEVGGYLLSVWGMRHPVVEAVTNHHHPSRVAGQSGAGVLTAVHVADALLNEHQIGSSSASTLDEEHLASLGLGSCLPEWRAVVEEEAGLAENPH